MKKWVAEINPDLIHITSCYSLSASVIESIRELDIPMVLTLTDFWFICPRHTLLRSNDDLCDGRTTNWECNDCMLSGNKAYQGLRPFLTNSLSAAGIEWVSKQPRLSNTRGLRGMALDMGDRKSYLQRMITIPDAVVAPSQYLMEVFAASGTAADIRVIPSGHDLSWLGSANEHEPSDTINIGFIGQITPIKGLHVLIEAFNTSHLINKAQLVIYGSFDPDPVYRERIQASISDHAESIFMRGSFPHDQLDDVLSEIDVLVVPSLWHENNPRVIQEAFAARTPVIASNVGGMSEFVKHESNGLLFDRNNEIDLSHQLSRIVSETDLLPRLQEGIKPVKTIELEVEELFLLYKELIR
jgi:glycosyltransferase involved in cell wall biosynthesis